MSRKTPTAIRQGEPAKTPKVWEKARREKMKIYFNELQEVLPLYDPSAPMSRFEILQKSRSYIKELQSQNQDLLDGGFDEVYKSKMEKLRHRVKELLQRVDQLTDLLRRANIMIPPFVPCPEKQGNLGFSQTWMKQRPKKWTEKINVVVPDEKIENILSLIKDFKKKNGKVTPGKKNCKSFQKQNDAKDENNCCVNKSTLSERIQLKKKKKKIKTPDTSKIAEKDCDTSEKSVSDSFNESQSPSHTKENQPVDFNLPSNEKNTESVVENVASTVRDKPEEDKTVSEPCEKVNSDNNTKTTNNGDKISVVSGKMKNLIEAQNNVFLPASTNVVQSNTFLLTNDGNLVQFPILNSSPNVFSGNTNLLAQTAIVNQPNSSLLTPLVINRPSPVIVFQKPAPQIQIVNPTPQILSVPNQNIQIVGNSIVCATSSQSSKSLPYIISKQPVSKKRIAKDSTTTTFVNKIPIPALSKQSYVKKIVNLNNSISNKGRNIGRTKDVKEKSPDKDKTGSGDTESEVQSSEKESQTEKCLDGISNDMNLRKERCRENEVRSTVDETGAQKRSIIEEDDLNPKKQKVSNDNSNENNVFKPIENPILPDPSVTNDAIFCNLKLPNSVGQNLSVSPTAAFLSTFPIVNSSKFEDELAGKIDERRTCEHKSSKPNAEKSKEKVNEEELPEVPKSCDVPVSEVAVPVKDNPQLSVEDGKEADITSKGILEKTNCDMNIVERTLNINANDSITKSHEKNRNIANGGGSTNISSDNNNIVNSEINHCTQLINTDKTWDDYQQGKNCEMRTDPFYISSDVQHPAPVIPDISSSLTNFPDSSSNISVCKNDYSQNGMKTNFNVINSDQMALKNNQFECGQKRINYNVERNVVKKPCSSIVNDAYNMPKNQPPMYQAESTPNYQLIPVKEMPNQRNTRPPVNWMTDPDVRTRSMSYGSASKIPPFTQPDIFYMNNQNVKQGDISGDYMLTDMNKLNYQKNDFCTNKNVDMQMKVTCKGIEKPAVPKFPAKPSPQNTSYNIFDYNYNGNYFGEEDGNKFYNVQNFPPKAKKTPAAMTKKKTDNSHLVNGDPQTNDATKRNTDQIITNMDFNPVSNQECFSWVPGKNVDWLPSKSFVDTNLILPSTLPTLVGDLALGTTTSNDVAQTKSNRVHQKEPIGKTYIDLGLNNASFGKDAINDSNNKQYLEPFTNLSKNIFDVTPSSNIQNTQKNDCEKNAYLSNTNETIVLKNIFELPVSKSSTNDFANRNKQRPVNNTQNTFLSVSQLVETPSYENNAIKNEAQMENSVAKQTESYVQNYSNGYHGNQKSYKNKTRTSHYKYNDRKYQNYKTTSSNYTAEALIRTNPNLSYQSNDFQSEVNSNFYTTKNTQKSDNFTGTNEAIPKTDFVPCSTQNIYTDFNFSSPVSNFNISTSVSSDYVSHDGNFASQNNTFFGDFIPPDYPITESVSNSLLLPPCSIGLQNPFIIEKRNGTPEKGTKPPVKHYSNSRSRKNFDCSKTSFSDFSTSAGIFTNPTIFTTTSCQNLLPVPNQNIPDPNLTFSASSFNTSNITFPPLASNSNANYHRVTTATHNATTTTFFHSSCHSMFTTCSTTTVSSSRTCPSTIPPTSSTNAVITTPFSVGNAPFPSSTQSSLPFLSLSNPIIPPSIPSTSGNSLANFNLSTIFPEINQKGNYHYP